MAFSCTAYLANIVGDIHEAADRAGLEEQVLKGLNAFGFDSINMSINAKRKPDLLMPEISSLRGTFLAEFERHGFVECDPILEGLVAAQRPFSWTNERAPVSERDKKLLEFLRSFGLRRGLVVPLPHMPGRISAANISGGAGVTYDEETINCVSIIVRVAMIKAESLGMCAGDAQARLVDADLSARQIEVLNWAAQGKSNGDIAIITGQSKRAVDYHMSEILRKLKVSTRGQAIALTAGARPSP